MKKRVFYIACAMLAFFSCNKDQEQYTDSEYITATIGHSITKTVVNTDITSADKGVISWEIGDEIKIFNSYSARTAYFEVVSIDVNGRATFVKTSGSDLGTKGTNHASFSSSYIERDQTYGPIKNLYMEAADASATEKEYTFYVKKCGLLRVNLKDVSHTIKSIDVTGIPTGGSETKYSLTCEESQDVSTAKDFYIVLPPGIYTKFQFYNSEYNSCIKSSSTGIEIVEATVTSIKFENLPAFSQDPQGSISEMIEETEIQTI